jgi:hypothetical protein
MVFASPLIYGLLISALHPSLLSKTAALRTSLQQQQPRVRDASGRAGHIILHIASALILDSTWS